MKRGIIADKAFRIACLGAVLLPLAALLVLLAMTLAAASSRLDLALLTGLSGSDPDRLGLLADLAGSLQLVVMTALIALPLGMGAAIYLAELSRRSRVAPLAELLVANLAAVPSIVYGLVGLMVFVRTIGLGRSLLSGSLTLALVILPTITLAAAEALRTVPETLREAGLALGATRWDTVRRIVLPSALPGMITGAILGLGRALGEGAALLVLGGFAYLSSAPAGPTGPLAALPLRIFFWASEPGPEHLRAAAAGVMVLLMALSLLGLGAVVLRHRAEARRG